MSNDIEMKPGAPEEAADFWCDANECYTDDCYRAFIAGVIWAKMHPKSIADWGTKDEDADD